MENLIEKMREHLKQLVETATKLRDLSKQTVTEAELIPLQQKQEKLLHDLKKIDQELENQDLKKEVHDEFHKKVQEFQTLNKDYVKNLNSSHGLIHFELRKMKK